MAGIYFESFDGAKIYYHKTQKDQNRWLVFLHGFGGDLTAWQKESITNPVIIGHCFGGMVAIYFQAQYPHYSKGLVLVDTSYKPPFIGNSRVAQVFTDHIINLLLKVLPNIKIGGHTDFNKFVGTYDLDFKRILSDILHTSLRSYLILSDELIKLDAKDLLDKILVPTLVVEGTKDSIFPPEIAKYLAKRIRKSELDLIEGTNHILVLNNPQDLEKSIESFLKKINFIYTPLVCGE